MPIASIVTAVVGGAVSYMGAKRAAKIQKDASDKAFAIQEKFFNTTRADLAPYREVGAGALGSLAKLYGIGTGGKPGGQPFDPAALEAFRRSPDYKFALEEGLKSVEASRAAKGLLKSGGTLEELQERGSGLASQNFGNYVSRLLQLANIGESSAAQTGSFASGASRGMADSIMAGGEASASGVVGGTNSITSMIDNLSKNLSLYKLMTPGGSAYNLSPSAFAYGAGGMSGLK